MYSVCIRLCNPDLTRTIKTVHGFKSEGAAAEWYEENADEICKNDDVDANDMPLDKGKDGGMPHWHTFDVGVPAESVLSP